MRAMLVAAGFGTRLHPLTRELPKPALPVANRPVAWFACDHLARSGFSDLVVNTHHLAGELRDALEPLCPAGVRLRFAHEPEILGTGGGVKNAWQPQDGEDFAVFNAKLLFAPDLGRALAVHRQSGAIATMVLRRLPAGTRFTAVHVDAGGFIQRIGSKPEAATASAHSAALEPRMFTGVQILSARAWRDLPQNGDIIRESYLAWLARGERVASITDDSPWMDIGVTLRHYLDANMALASSALRWPGIAPGPRGVFADASAILGDACDVEHAAIGTGAIVAPGARLRRAVLWPGAHAEGELHDAIVTSTGNVVRV